MSFFYAGNNFLVMEQIEQLMAIIASKLEEDNWGFLMVSIIMTYLK